MTEKEKFEEIQRSYNGADLPGILSEQQIKVNQLNTKKVQLQQTVIGKSFFFRNFFVTFFNFVLFRTHKAFQGANRILQS